MKQHDADFNPLTKVDEELSQSRARVVIVGLISLILWVNWFFSKISLTAALISTTYGLISLFWFIAVKKKPGDFPLRRVISIIGDLGISSLVMITSGPISFSFYPVYLWIIVGNGMRFGKKYLFFGLALGILGLSIVSMTNPLWIDNKYISLGLMVGLIILPLFYLSLLNRLHTLNEQLTQQLSKTEYTATHDGLTDLTNRSHFFSRLDEEIKWATRNKSVFAIVYIDLDGFKQINDNYNHHTGDQLLVEVSKILISNVREIDVVARIGGDEFVILLRTISDHIQVDKVVNRILPSISTISELFDNKMRVSASLGVSSFPVNGMTSEELINKADFAMYLAKYHGKNKCIQYSNDIHEKEYSRQVSKPIA